MIEVYYGLKLFEGRSSVEVLAAVIKVIGTPTSEELIKMKVPLKSLKMPKVTRLGM